MIKKISSHARRSIEKGARHTLHLSRHSFRYMLFLGGAACVALMSLGFAWLAERMLSWNDHLIHANRWIAFLLLPFGFAGLRWLTIRHAMQARGSGIPQVIAAMSLPGNSGAINVLVSLTQSLWKIVLTSAGLLVGASIGREGPSVQVGAAMMWSWGEWWHKRIKAGFGFRPEALIAAGAAGGLAAAFNTPLAGVVFAIEELGRGSAIHWDRIVMAGVLTSGFLSLALVGNYSYFELAQPILYNSQAWSAVAVSALVCGIFGGLFSRTLIGGIPGMLPRRWRKLPMKCPLRIAFCCGALVALLGLLSDGSTYGTGYAQASALLNGDTTQNLWFGASKWAATVLSYFAGIPGGIFTPSLAIGAGIGNYIGLLFHTLAEPRMLVLLSMAAFLAGATQAPITASVIVMEMTHTQNLTLYLLAATLVASFVSRLFSPKPFYHAVSKRFRREAIDKDEQRKQSGPPDGDGKRVVRVLDSPA